MKKLLLLFCLWSTATLLVSASIPAAGASVYPLPPKDAKAVYLTAENFTVKGDGVADDAPALQAAIDLVLKQSRGGIVFVPAGTYRLGKTVYLWSGIRLIGYGATRPTFLLADNTPGFQEGDHRYMVHFAQRPGGNNSPVQPGTWTTPTFMDGTWVTFYSGISNINFKIGEGNAAAIAVRYHIAQVCFLEHIDFNIGSARGAVEEMGNLIENCTFRGGQWAIKTGSSAPDWQCLTLDCTFEGQREAGIITTNAKMLVIRSRFKAMPVGIHLPDRDKLYVRDSRFESLSDTAIRVDNFVPPDLQVNLENVTVASTPFTVRFNGRTQGWNKNEVRWDYAAPAPAYVVRNFSHGLHVTVPAGEAGATEFATKIDESPLLALGEFTPRDMPPLPPQSTWVNLADLGAAGDDTTDCTAIFEKAIAEHDTLYVPMGRYVISRTLTLRPATTLIGLHPSLTQLVLRDRTPGFTEAAQPQPLVVVPKGGTNGITGIGFNLGFNPGVIGIKWMAGPKSYLNDSLFNGGSGGGGGGAPGAGGPPAPGAAGEASRRERRAEIFGKGQAVTLWVTDGGGGIFKNFWMNDIRSKVPVLISDTATPGTIYEISIEHHKEVEVKLENVQNWTFHALQLEEDRGCEQTLGIYLKDSRNISFTNLISHRTTGVWQPFHTAIQMRNSHAISIRGCEIRGAVFPYDNVLFDEGTGTVVPRRILTRLEVK